jgi:leucyl-tRNA synthetase
MPVDLYVGGAEHATRHLLYARFWHKFLFDIGVVSTNEPFKKLMHVGLINAEDGRKMSKRWNNVVNPDEVIAEFGADAMRLYEMFMGPFVQNIAWSTKGVVGTKRFLEKVWNLQTRISEQETANNNLSNLLHKTIKKVGEDIENFRFNTAVSQLMILVNEMEKEKEIFEDDYKTLIIILAPFAPHICEEIWHEKLGHKESIFQEKWPKYDPELIKDEMFELIVQISGKVRDKIMAKMDISESEAKEVAMQSEKVKGNISGKEIKKVIFVKNRLINIVV